MRDEHRIYQSGLNVVFTQVVSSVCNNVYSRLRDELAVILDKFQNHQYMYSPL